MKVSRIVRAASIFGAAGLCIFLGGSTAPAQDVGGNTGGAAGIFRPKNPEIKKRTRPTTRNTPRRPSVDEKVDDLLDQGNTARDARKFAEAENFYNAALKLKPRDGRAAYGLGNVYTDQQRWDDAERSYRDAVTWDPKDVDAHVALSVVLVEPRPGAGNARRFADAEAAARRAIELDPRNAVAWDRLGVALQSRGLFNTETEHAYRRAVELDPQFAVAYAHLGRVLKRMGRADEAAPLYEKAVTLAKDPPTLNLIAESLQAEQQWENSEPVLKRALEIDAKNPTALLLMGRMLVVMKRYNEAEPYLKSATQVSPLAFQPYNLLGRAYLALDRYEDAEITYERAVDTASPGDRKQLASLYGFEGVGDGFMKAKRKDAAARAYKRALELDPGNKQLEKKLSKAR